MVTYTLTLDRSTCHFQAEGFQTDEDIVCTTLMSGDTLDVRFKSYGNGQLEDKYGNAVYHVGDSLFTLSKQGSMLITHGRDIRSRMIAPIAPACISTIKGLRSMLTPKHATGGLSYP